METIGKHDKELKESDMSFSLQVRSDEKAKCHNNRRELHSAGCLVIFDLCYLFRAIQTALCCALPKVRLQMELSHHLPCIE